MITVLYPDGRQRSVSNLGYILRAAKDVTYIIIGTDGVTLQAILSDGRQVVATFGTPVTLRGWIDRRAFAHVRVMEGHEF